MRPLRIYVLPFYRHHLAFYAPFEFNSVPPFLQSTITTTRDIGEDSRSRNSPSPMTPPLSPAAPSTATLTTRITNVGKALFHRGQALIHNKWVEFRDAAPGSWKHTVYSKGNQLLRRIPAEETFLCRIYERLHFFQARIQHGHHAPSTSNLPMIEIIAPSVVDSSIVKAALDDLARRKESHHRRYLIYSILGLPFSALMSILPAPNVFFAYNAFRVYCHYRAYYSSKTLVQWMVPNSKLGEDPSSLMPPCQWTVSHPEELSQVYQHIDVRKAPLSTKHIEAIAEKFQSADIAEELGRYIWQLSKKSEKSLHQEKV